MQLVLDNQVRRSQWTMRLPLHPRLAISRRMIAGILQLDLRRQKSMAHTQTVQLPEQILRLAFPRHLRELVDSRYQQGWRSTVDVFIDHHDRQAFHRCFGLRELAIASRVAAISDA